MEDERALERNRAQAAFKREAQKDFGWGIVICVIAGLALAFSLFLAWQRLDAAFDAGAPDLWHALYLSDTQASRMTSGDAVQAPAPSVTIEYFSASSANDLTAVTMLSEGVVTMALAFVICVIATRAASELSDTGRPFTAGMVRALKRVGRLLTYMFLLPTLMGLVIAWAAPPDVTLVVGGGSVYLLLAGSFVLMFARFFEYGCILQQQDDELL